MAGRPRWILSSLGQGEWDGGIDYYSRWPGLALAMEESRKETDVGAGGDDAEWMDGRCVCVCLPGMDGCLSDMAEFPCPRHLSAA